MALMIAVLLLLPLFVTSFPVVAALWGSKRSSRLSITFLQESASSKEERDSRSTDDDWREFRAKLIRSTAATRRRRPADGAIDDDDDSERLVYDAGHVIEKGFIVLSQVESSLGCHDLNQPYLHKAVVLLLLLDHDDEGGGGSPQGVLLNRRTDLILSDEDIVYLDDDFDNGVAYTIRETTASACSTASDGANKNISDNNSNRWRMNFGGDISGLYDEKPVIVCLHSIATNLARNVSDTVLKSFFNENDDDDVLVTSHDGACRLIQAGEATSDDFFVYCGYCAWENKGQLLHELQRGSWSMVAADSATVWKELQKQRVQDPRAAGISMWESLTAKLGKDSSVGVDSFSDLMLKEWAAERLCIARKDDNNNDDDDDCCDDSLILRAIDVATKSEQFIEPGMLVRGSSRNPSPFLLHEQLLHKSIILVFQENITNSEASVGLILNLPTTDVYVLQSPGGKTVEFTIRRGGVSGAEGVEPPLIWLHCSKSLRRFGIGAPLNDMGGRIWTCTTQQVAEAIDLELAIAAEFLVVQGFTVWEKEQQSTGGISGQVLEGNLEAVSSSQVENTWSLLQSQKRLTEDSLDWNINASMNAWTIAGLSRKKSGKKEDDSGGSSSSSSSSSRPRLVFDTNVTVSELADEALKNWVDIFLLGDGAV